MLIAISISIILLVPLSTWWFGFWNNMLTTINCLLAALIATSAYPLISQRVIDVDPESYTYTGDFVGLWAFFVISFLLLRGITDMVSKVKLKFDMITEMAGRTIFSIATALVLVCFTNFTLQLAPLDQELFAESGEPTGPAVSSIADQSWLSFTQYASTGPLAAGSPIPNTFYEAASRRRYDNWVAKEARADAKAEFDKKNKKGPR
ncbi:hypothetical protein N9Y42_02220 [Mariniblastus sp.]|nr:hypothetical protein [Mariniblastus sp.]